MIDEPLALLAEAFGQDPELEARPTGQHVPMTEPTGSDPCAAVFTSGPADAAKPDARRV